MLLVSGGRSRGAVQCLAVQRRPLEKEQSSPDGNGAKAGKPCTKGSPQARTPLLLFLGI